MVLCRCQDVSSCLCKRTVILNLICTECFITSVTFCIHIQSNFMIYIIWELQMDTLLCQENTRGLFDWYYERLSGWQNLDSRWLITYLACTHSHGLLQLSIYIIHTFHLNVICLVLFSDIGSLFCLTTIICWLPLLQHCTLGWSAEEAALINMNRMWHRTVLR